MARGTLHVEDYYEISYEHKNLEIIFTIRYKNVCRRNQISLNYFSAKINHILDNDINLSINISIRM